MLEALPDEVRAHEAKGKKRTRPRPRPREAILLSREAIPLATPALLLGHKVPPTPFRAPHSTSDEEQRVGWRRTNHQLPRSMRTIGRASW